MLESTWSTKLMYKYIIICSPQSEWLGWSFCILYAYAVWCFVVSQAKSSVE